MDDTTLDTQDVHGSQDEDQSGGEHGSSLKEFFEPARTHLDDAVEEILNHPDALTDEQLTDLHAILQHYLPEAVHYGADFDFTQEITAQITSIRALRLKVMRPNGTLKEDVTTREAKEVITASASLLQQLMKHHDKIQNFERQRAIEEATTQAIKTLPSEVQQKFFDTLKELLTRLEG